MALTPAERRFVRHWEEERGGGRGAFLVRYTLAYFVVAYLCSVALALFLSIPFIKLLWLGLIAIFSLVLAFVVSVWVWRQNQRRFQAIIHREMGQNSPA
jgi:protein-S-isoprenylcysteine O-methyltransferase Ste14